MIVDKTVLEADSQPQEILHRHEQINYLSDILEPIADGDRVDGAFIYGSTGTGKTATSRFLCDRLEQESVTVQTAYVDYWANSNRPAILHRLLEGINQPTPGLHRRTPSDELSKALRQKLESPFVAILDEADQIEDQAALYELYENPLVTVFLIANDDEEFFAALEQRVDSRLVTIPRIHFRKYTDRELVSILEVRAEAGLEPGVIGHDEFFTIADAAARDARVAIGILRNVAEYATRDGLERITTSDIRDHVPIARREVRQNTVRIIPPLIGTVQRIYTAYKQPLSSSGIPLEVGHDLADGVGLRPLWKFTSTRTLISYTQQRAVTYGQNDSQRTPISYVTVAVLPIPISYILESANAISYIGSPSIITIVSVIFVGAIQEDLTAYSADQEETPSGEPDQTVDESEKTSSDPSKPGVIYARVSTNQQAKDGRSLEAQTDDLLQIAERNDIDLVCDPIKDEGKTGTDFDRDGIRRVFDLANSGQISYLLVDDISRLGRNAPQTLYFVYLLRSKCDVVIITHSGELNVRRVQDLLEMTMKALISHMSTLGRARSTLRSRVRGFTEDRNWRSGFPQGVPLGYTETDDGWIQPDRDEAEVIQRMFDRFLETESYTATAETLNDEFEDVLEDQLSYSQVKNYLQKPVYIGKPTVHAELTDTDADRGQSEHVVEDPTLSLVERETFDQAAEIIDTISTKNAREDDTLDLENAIDEFGLFPVESSSPIVKLVCEECSSDLRKNGQRKLNGEIRCHNYQCKNCGKQRKYPTKMELKTLRLKSEEIE